MPVLVRYNNDSNQDCVLRPAPLVAISTESNKTGGGESFGTTYTITLTGSVLESRGFPLARKVADNSLFPYNDGGTAINDNDMIGPYKSFDKTTSHFTVESAGEIIDRRPRVQAVPQTHTLDSLFFKQKALRALFARDGQRVEIIPIHGDEAAVICYPRVRSISFSEGQYVNRTDYTITLEADTLLDRNLKVDNEGSPAYLKDATASGLLTKEILKASGNFISSMSESWSLEADDALGEHGEDLPKSYRISHTMNATGKTHTYPDAVGVKTIPAWQNARDWVQQRLMPATTGVLANISSYPNVLGKIGSGTLNLISAYQGFNHTRTEEVGVSDGSYSVTENWLIASGTAYENYNLSISSDTSAPFVSVSIDGSIKGLTSSPPSGERFGGLGGSGMQSAYSNALKKYREVTNNGSFGLTSNVYKRANKSVAVELNATPNSVSLGTNEYDGSVTYNLSFDNRPVNMISGVLSENISVNDTYPGDVFAQIQVLGRATGPILQYIGGRTAYKRDLNMELVMDYTDIPYGSGRAALMLTKPSLVEPTASQIRQVIESISPENEPGIRKYFIDPPSESWTPKEGRWSFNISWTYELDK